MSLAMSEADRFAYLADLHVGVICVDVEERAPLAVPIWYAYEPGGEVRVITDRGSRKHTAIERTGRFSLCVQNEAPPYSYVTVEGPVTGIEPADVERDLRPIARRYLGTEGGDAYVAQSPESPETSVVIRMTPEHWLSADFAKSGS